MICKKCQEQGLRSRVIIPSQVLILPMGGPHCFYDEDNRFHRHDADIREEAWHCSNGHHWTRVFRAPCVVAECDWNDRPNIGETITWHEEKSEEKVENQ